MFEILAVLDRSGSMRGNEMDVITGYNKFIEEQRKEGEDKLVTLVIFDDNIDTVYEAMPITQVVELTDDVYYPRNMTRLMDAVGMTMQFAGERYAHSDIKPEGVSMLIYTDGYENASQEYTTKSVGDMIKLQTDTYDWEFTFFGADMDAFSVTKDIHVPLDGTISIGKTAEEYTSGFASASSRAANYTSLRRNGGTTA